MISIQRLHLVRRLSAGRLRELLAVLPVGVGMSIRNAAAVLEGLVHTGGYFRRTPKQGDHASRVSDGRPRMPWLEIALTMLFIAAVMAFAARRHWVSLPFLALFVSGYGYIAAHALHERLTHIKSAV